MDNSQIEAINKNIHFLEGKIYWQPLYGYTSKLMQRFIKDYNFVASTNGTLHFLKDTQGKTVCTGYSWVGLLENLAILMR